MHARDFARSGMGMEEGYAAPGRLDRVHEEPAADRRSDQDAARHVASGVERLGLVARAEAWQARGRSGLTPTQAQILSLLRTAEPEPLTLRALARGLAVSSATASESLDTLVGKGMAVRGRSKRDARALAVRLTDLGRREAETRRTTAQPLLEAAADLQEQEQAALLRGLIRMIHNLEEDGRIAPARMCVSCRYFRPKSRPDDSAAPHHCGFLDSPFGDRQLRIDCEDYAPAEPDVAKRNWQIFAR
jgi:DNA-binding MarR family transcriptional regulator